MLFTLGLNEGGLMEDPGRHIEHIQSVEALTLREAKQKWAELTGHDDPKYWDPERQTYWGWGVVQVCGRGVSSTPNTEVIDII